MSKRPQHASKRPSTSSAHHGGHKLPAAKESAPNHQVSSSGRGKPSDERAEPYSRASTRPQQPGMRRYQHIALQRRRKLLLEVSAALVAGVTLLAIVYVTGAVGVSGAKAGQPGQFRFDVASPATGALAPDFSLPSTTGGTVRLSDFRGKNVLLYFQEGIGCEGCWTQMKDIQGAMKDFHGLGIDTMLTVTTNPLGALKQKVADERLSLPVLSDESFAVSRSYNATAYGMMAGSADGHTFILVGPEGRIRWRADYGGPPDYTMYVPVSNLIADIKAGMKVDTNGQ